MPNSPTATISMTTVTRRSVAISISRRIARFLCRGIFFAHIREFRVARPVYDGYARVLLDAGLADRNNVLIVMQATDDLDHAPVAVARFYRSPDRAAVFHDKHAGRALVLDNRAARYLRYILMHIV